VAEKPASILYGGIIHTMRGRDGMADAIAISEGGMILAAGKNHEMEYWGGPGTKRVHLGGRAVYPGFCDSHNHFFDYCLSLERLALARKNLPEIRSFLRERCKALPPGRWIVGHGWSPEGVGLGKFPAAGDLDAVSPKHPVLLWSHDFHAAWCNSAALMEGVKAGILKQDAVEAGGILFEETAWDMGKLIPFPAEEDALRLLRKGMGEAAAMGVTALHEFSSLRALPLYRKLREADGLACRIYKIVRDEELDAALREGLRTGFGDEWIRVGPCKIFSDGALGSRTAAMHKPYAGSHERGMLTCSPESLLDAMRKASRGNFRLAVHAIGDRAVSMVLDGYENLYRDAPNGGGVPDRIEHAQHLSPSDLPRFAALGIAAAMQPFHMEDDIPIVGSVLAGHESLPFPCGSLFRHGALLAFGSDAPIASMDVRLGLRAAAARRLLSGGPPCVPGESLELRGALWAYTAGGAHLSGEASFKGTLEPGKAADLVVMERDLFGASPDEWPGVPVAATMAGGRWTFNALE
jgi:hypothetical protein